MKFLWKVDNFSCNFCKKTNNYNGKNDEHIVSHDVDDKKGSERWGNLSHNDKLNTATKKVITIRIKNNNNENNKLTPHAYSPSLKGFEHLTLRRGEVRLGKVNVKLK